MNIHKHSTKGPGMAEPTRKAAGAGPGAINGASQDKSGTELPGGKGNPSLSSGTSPRKGGGLKGGGKTSGAGPGMAGMGGQSRR